MTADSEKESIHCLICNSKVGVSTRNSVRIFNQTTLISNEKPLADLISVILETDINEKNVHSAVVCKKCFKLFNEVDELQNRITEIKFEIVNNYKKTVKYFEDNFTVEEEYNDHDYLETFESHSQGPQSIVQNQAEIDHKRKDVGQKSDDVEKIEEIEEDTIESHFEEEMLNEEKNDEPLDDLDTVVVKTEVISADDSSLGNKKVPPKKQKLNVKVEETVEQIVSKDGDVYTCLLCPNDNKCDAKSIIAHLKEEHDTRLYICDVCGAEFRKRNDLSFHLDDHVAKEEGDFQCEVCNRIFNNLRLFRIHRRIHYPQVKSWPCETCGKRYSSKNLLEEHMNTHTGVRPYICEVCGKDFASKYTFKAHSKIHEVRPRPFECSQCSKSFLSQQNLNQHERTHNGVKEYVCHQCGKAFGSPHNLEVHNIVHTGYKPYICKMCGKAFARKAEIRDHERTHTGEKPYQCEFCGATFSQRSNLQSHKRATHYNDKRYKCDECGKGFKRRRLLDYHLKAVHTGERPYKCSTCSATFVYPEHFKKHKRIHTGEKPYLCEVCGKAFNSRDNRNAHRFIHSDKKPYECLVCGMGFMRKPLLYTHMQTQGHLNDTIVVNQPRLTTEDDQVITIPSGNVELLMENTDAEQLGGTELYVTELKDHVIIQQDEQIYSEGNVLNIASDDTVSKDGVQQLVVDGQINLQGEVMECKAEDAEMAEEVYTYQESEEGETIVVPATTELKAVESDGKGAVRFVQIQIPSSIAGGSSSWLSLVKNT